MAANPPPNDGSSVNEENEWVKVSFLIFLLVWRFVVALSPLGSVSLLYPLTKVHEWALTNRKNYPNYAERTSAYGCQTINTSRHSGMHRAVIWPSYVLELPIEFFFLENWWTRKWECPIEWAVKGETAHAEQCIVRFYFMGNMCLRKMLSSLEKENNRLCSENEAWVSKFEAAEEGMS